jgi:hypothetical protein
MNWVTLKKEEIWARCSYLLEHELWFVSEETDLVGRMPAGGCNELAVTGTLSCYHALVTWTKHNQISFKSCNRMYSRQKNLMLLTSGKLNVTNWQSCFPGFLDHIILKLGQSNSDNIDPCVFFNQIINIYMLAMTVLLHCSLLSSNNAWDTRFLGQKIPTRWWILH